MMASKQGCWALYSIFVLISALITCSMSMVAFEWRMDFYAVPRRSAVALAVHPREMPQGGGLAPWLLKQGELEGGLTAPRPSDDFK
jgi:hypothetical protein